VNGIKVAVAEVADRRHHGKIRKTIFETFLSGRLTIAAKKEADRRH
jgi:hypothetical protein